MSESRHERARSLVSHPSVGPIVEAAVRHAARVFPSLSDEFEAEAWLALWEAALRYEEDSVVGWEHFLRVRLRNSLVDCRRRWTHVWHDTASRQAVLPLDRAGRDRGTGEDSGADEIESRERPVGWEHEYQEESDRLTRAMSRLSEKSAEEATIIGELYGLGAGGPTFPAKLGRRLGIPRDDVDRARRRGMRYLRKVFREEMGVAG